MKGHVQQLGPLRLFFIAYMQTTSLSLPFAVANTYLLPQQPAINVDIIQLTASQTVAAAVNLRVLVLSVGVGGVICKQAAVFARMSSKETGYFVKMAAKSGSVETFNGVTDMMARNGKVWVVAYTLLQCRRRTLLLQSTTAGFRPLWRVPACRIHGVQTGAHMMQGNISHQAKHWKNVARSTYARETKEGLLAHAQELRDHPHRKCHNSETTKQNTEPLDLTQQLGQYHNSHVSAHFSPVPARTLKANFTHRNTGRSPLVRGERTLRLYLRLLAEVFLLTASPRRTYQASAGQ